MATPSPLRRACSLGLAASLSLLCLATSCAYDNEAEIFGPLESASCDTTNVTYAGTIAPIMRANCYSCHRAGFTEGGVATDTYGDVALLCRTNQLLGVITHAPGYPAMPRDAPRLSDCDIEKIRVWIAAGSPNN